MDDVNVSFGPNLELQKKRISQNPMGFSNGCKHQTGGMLPISASLFSVVTWSVLVQSEIELFDNQFFGIDAKEVLVFTSGLGWAGRLFLWQIQNLFFGEDS